MFLPLVLYQSLRRRHFLVFLVCLVSIALKVEIVLSPSMFDDVQVVRSASVPVRIMDSFRTTNTATLAGSGDAFYFARAVNTFQMTPPFGVSDDLAYQTFFHSAGDGTHTTNVRGSTDTHVKAIVDGAFTNMTCLKLEKYSSTRQVRWAKYHPYGHTGGYNFTYLVDFQGCRDTLTVPGPWWASREGFGMFAFVTSPVAAGSCSSSLPQQHDAFVYHVATFQPSPLNESVPELKDLAAVLCSPYAWLSKVEVVDDGIRPNVSILPDQEQVAVASDPWAFAMLQLPPFLQLNVSTRNSTGRPIELDRYLRGLDWIDDVTYSNEILEQALKNISQFLAPMTAHFVLREDSDEEKLVSVDGAIQVHVNMLQMRPPICAAVLAFLSLCILTASWAVILSWRGALLVWHRDPATALGSMLFCHATSRELLDYSSGLTQKSQCQLRDKIQASGAAAIGGDDWGDGMAAPPLALQSWLRVIFVLYSSALIVTLLVTLRMSLRYDGLATVAPDEDDSWSFWKSIAALLMLPIVLYTAASDAALRSLATLSNLSVKNCDAKQLDQSLLDTIGLRALYLSLRLRIPAVTVSQVVVTLCTFLTTLSSVLLHSEPVPEVTHVTLPQSTWFGLDPEVNTSDGRTVMDSADGKRAPLAALMLSNITMNSDLRYPQNTYGDLLFPTLQLDPMAMGTGRASSVNVTMPAARATHSCQQLNGLDFEISKHNYDNESIKLKFRNYTMFPGGPEGTWSTAPLNKSFPLHYFARTLPFSRSVESDYRWHPWKIRSYLWGAFDIPGDKFMFFTAWRCNYSWTELVADVTLIPTSISAAGSFEIDPSRPPVVREESTTKPWQPPFTMPDVRDGDSNHRPSVFPPMVEASPFLQLSSQFYRSLIQPMGGTAFEFLADPDKDTFVLDKINEKMRLALAQIANLESRLDLDQESATEPFRHGDLPPVQGTMTDDKHHRIIQNPSITYALVVILFLAMVPNAWAVVSSCYLRRRRRGPKPQQSEFAENAALTGARPGLTPWWLLDLDLAGLAPRDFNSVAATRALLDRSSALQFLPCGGHLLSKMQLYRHLRAKEFRMGLYVDRETQLQHFMIGVVDDTRYLLLDRDS